MKPEITSFGRLRMAARPDAGVQRVGSPLLCPGRIGVGATYTGTGERPA